MSNVKKILILTFGLILGFGIVAQAEAQSIKKCKNFQEKMIPLNKKQGEGEKKDKTQFYTREYGEGQVVILLHGGPGDGGYMGDIVLPFCNDYRFVEYLSLIHI